MLPSRLLTAQMLCKATLERALLMGALTVVSACSANAVVPTSNVQATSPTSEDAGAADWFTAIPEASTALDAEVKLTLDTHHAALATTHREPQAGPVQSTRIRGASVDVTGRAKTIAARPGWVWVDLYLENHADVALRDVTFALSSSSPLFDVNVDPLTETPLRASAQSSDPLSVGGVAARGVLHVALAVKESINPIDIGLVIRGTTTTRREQHSSGIAVSPDGEEVWAVSSDANTVSVVDTASDTKIATLPVPANPSSVAITPDGALVLVACANDNRVVIVDRKERRVLQILGESGGMGRDLRHIVVSPDGTHAYVSAYVSDRITSLRRRVDGTYSVDGVLPVGRRPVGMAATADGGALYVAHFLPRGTASDNEGWVSVLRPSPLSLSREAIWRDAGNRKEASCLAQRFGQPADALLFEGVSTQLAGVFLAPGGALAWVPGLRVGPTALWELASGKVLPGITRATFSPAFLSFMDTRDPGRAAPKLSPLVVDVPDADIDFLRCGKLTYESESVVRTAVPGEVNAIFSNGAAVPTGSTALSEAGVSRFVAFSRGGRRALVLSFTADELQLFDTATQHASAQRQLKLSGSNPVSLVVTPNGAKAYVLYENSTFLSVLDLSALADPESLPVASFVPFEYRTTARANNSFLTSSRLVRFVGEVPELPPVREIKQIRVADADPLDPIVRRGRILFSSSNPDKYPTLTASRQAACAACHPGGGHDGAVWATMEGERRTLSLRGGVFGRGWLHQSGTHRDILEFTDTIVPERLGGTGLNASDSAAMATYIARHIPKLQAPEVDDAKAARGKKIFATSCAGCHQGPAFSGGATDGNDPWGGGLARGPALYDVGTASSTSNVILPSFFTSRLPPLSSQLYDSVRGDRDLGDGDVAQTTLDFRARPKRTRGFIRPPSLVNAWDFSVFFHDGRYTSLDQAVRHLNTALALGLAEPEIDDVVAYVKTL